MHGMKEAVSRHERQKHASRCLIQWLKVATSHAALLSDTGQRFFKPYSDALLGGSRRVEFRMKVNSDATWMNAARSGLR